RTGGSAEGLLDGTGNAGFERVRAGDEQVADSLIPPVHACEGADICAVADQESGYLGCVARHSLSIRLYPVRSDVVKQCGPVAVVGAARNKAGRLLDPLRQGGEVSGENEFYRRFETGIRFAIACARRTGPGLESMRPSHRGKGVFHGE